MNTNSGNDPMLSSFIGDEWGKFTALFVTSSASPSPVPSLTIPQPTIGGFPSVDGLLSPEPSLSDFSTMWPNERKRVTSIKLEEDDAFTASPYSSSGDVDSGDIDMEEIDIGSNTTVEVKSEIEDPDFDDIAMADSVESSSHNIKYETNTLQMTEAEARRYVEEQFENIAFVPSSTMSQREKIAFILAKSDCADFTVDDVLNFDKRSGDSARACAKIVQNIPQRYRWECVKPEDIPCCYTIVADCKKVSCRDKPPRPMNAFMIWAQGARRLINELCPKMQNALISEALGYYWRQKSEAFKKRFEQEKIKLRGFHNVEFPEYKYKPKTKVQKQKEKQELSLNKAKMRATVKREKMRQAEESNLYRRRTTTKSGRPRKTKSAQEKKEVNKSSSSFAIAPDNAMKMSPTKPAIKDMLTLKILNDRRSKDAVNSAPKSNEVVHSAFGQLSPLEVDNPNMGDIFDELGNMDTVVASSNHRDTDISGKSMPSSVYDTPANTPPVDVDEEPHHSPLQQQQHHHHHQPVVVSSPLPTTVQIQAEVHQTKPCTSSETFVPKQMLMPSLSAMLSSPAKLAPGVRNTQGLSVVSFVQKPASLTTVKQLPAVPSSQSRATNDLTELLLTYVTEVMAPTTSKQGSLRVKDVANSNNFIDANNNSSDVNNNSSSDANNNSIGLPPSYAVSVMNSKLSQSLMNNGLNDLDTLSLDLNVPLLSDDDMRSLLSTL